MIPDQGAKLLELTAGQLLWRWAPRPGQKPSHAALTASLRDRRAAAESERGSSGPRSVQQTPHPRKKRNSTLRWQIAHRATSPASRASF
eukprot:2685473-Rhodomonas_salina.2